MIKIIRHYYVNKMTYDWVRSLAKWDTMSAGTYDLFVSLLTRSAWRYKINSHKDDLSPAYPLHNRWLRKIKASPKEIPENLIGCDNTWVKPSNSQPGKCRYYWINNDIIRAFETLIFSKSPHCINLYTGKPARKDRPLPTDIQQPSLYDKNRNLKTSELVAESIRIITNQQVQINFECFEKSVLRLNDWFQRKSNYSLDNPNLKGRLVKNTRAALSLYAHLKKFRNPKDGLVSYYVPVYRPLYTGRIAEQCIGLQSCSRIMRKALLKNTEYANFDLQNAQLNCLHYLLQPGNIKNDLAKRAARIFADAESFGLPKKLVKPFLYAYIFNCGRLNYRIPAIMALKTYCRKHKLLTNFGDFLAGLTPIKLATDTLLLSIKEKQAPYINHAGVVLTAVALEKLAKDKLDAYLRKNKTTMLCFPRQDYINHAKDKILLAFFVQGVEAYIIHTLTVNSSSDTYTVIANQYDGVIITGDKKAVYEQMAKINKNMNANFTLIEKPI